MNKIDTMNESTDFCRKMLRTIRENEENNSNDSVPITDDFGERGLSGQKNAFIEAIQSNVSFGDNPLIFYPDDKDIVFSGTITDLNNLKWQFRFNDPSGSGCYIWADALPLNQNNLAKLGRIEGYYNNWRQDIITHNLIDEWTSQSRSNRD